jgi:hypothetical protein
MRFLGMISPPRFMERDDLHLLYEGSWLRKGKTFDFAKVTQLTEMGIQNVSGIQTSTKTIITEGYLTHNSFWYYTKANKAAFIRNKTIRFQPFRLDTIWWQDHIAVTNAWLIAIKEDKRRPHPLEI